MGKELILLLVDIRTQMVLDSELIADEFGGNKDWPEYCKDTKAILDRIDKLLESEDVELKPLSEISRWTQ